MSAALASRRRDDVSLARRVRGEKGAGHRLLSIYRFPTTRVADVPERQAYGT